MADGKLLGMADLDLRTGTAETGTMPINLRAAREVADRRAIHQALTRTEHNISGAARLLGISRPTLYDLIKQYQLQA
jgi:two-component system NtrC family response regulator